MAKKLNCISGTRHVRSMTGSMVAAVAALAALPAASQAEAVDSEPAGRATEVIIVTAERREESILDVPLTMTAFDGEAIDELGLTNALDLEQLVPGLQLGSAALQQRSDGQGITIRGIGTQSARELHSDLAVAIYVDGVYTVDTYGLAPNLFDMERVEVARGPQGTLNGRNSIAGAIHFHTRKPTDTWDAKFLSEFTNQFTQRYNVAFGGPLGGGFSFRINGGYHGGDGTQENIGTGQDLGAPDQRTLSPQLRFQNDHVDINFRYLNVVDEGSEEMLVPFGDRDRTDPDTGNWYLNDSPIPSIAKCSNPVTIVGFTPQPITGKLICDDIRNVVVSNRSGIQQHETDRFVVSGDWKLQDTLVLQYTYGRSDTGTSASQDGDGTSRVGRADNPAIPADLDASEVVIWVESGASFADADVVHSFTNEEQSHELQLVSFFDGAFNFVAGIYAYENETFFEHGSLDYASPLRFVDADAAAVEASPIFGAYPVTSCASYLDDFFLPTFGDPETRTAFGLSVACPEGMDHTKTFSFYSSTASQTTAAYVNGEYEFDDHWRIAAGLRWTEDEKERTARVPPGVNPGSGQAGSVPSSAFVGDFFGTGVPVAFTGFFENLAPTSWSAVIGQISVEYRPEEHYMHYGRVSTGYRAGGFNFAGADIKETFDEEELINYEIGTKGTFLDGRLRLSTGLFYQVFEGYQLTANQPVDPRFLQPTDQSPLREQTINVGSDTKIWGVEVEGAYYLSDRLWIAGYYNFLGSELGTHSTVVRADPDQQYTDYTFTNPRFPEGKDGIIGTADDFIDTNRVPVPRDHTGDELPQMPNHKGAVTVSYLVPLAERGRLQLLGTWSYTGARWPQRAGNIPRAEVPAYARIDLRANWTSPSEEIGISAFVQNLTDEIGVSESISIDLIGSLTEPRTVGVQVWWEPSFD
ncbi:MAG: TonB-dependent receptor [Pseudomonadales bacterium]|nr:TonB-dependent receptor [Pseudomonadales bacterium]